MKHSRMPDDSFAIETAEMEINLLKAQIEKYENIIMYANNTIETQYREIKRLMEIVNPVIIRPFGSVLQREQYG